MISPLLAVGIFILFLIYAYKWSFVRPENYAPGPPRIPFFGSYLFMLLLDYKYMHKAALKLSKIYKSKILSLYMGPYLVYVVNDPDGVREVLNNSDFDGRPDIYLARMRHPEDKRKGIFFNDGAIWKEQRRFVLRYLRDYGFGRRFDELECVIQEEIQDLLDMMKQGPKYPHEHKLVKNNKAFCPLVFTSCTTNSFFHILFNERKQRSEHEFLMKVCESFLVLQRHGDDYGRMISIMPWIRHYFPKLSGYKILRKAFMEQYDMFKAIVEENLKTFNPNNCDENAGFIELYIREMRKAEGAKDESFELCQFIFNCMDFSLPAVTALPVQISMFLQWILIHPEIARKIQEEIEINVGDGRLPCLDDRKNLHYTEAAVREICRLETLVPSDVPHSAVVDTKIMGYTVPAYTIVVPSLYAFHNDPDTWDEPRKFKPERFLDSNGKLCLKKDISLPFGAGKRLCAGETFARNMMFLMISSLLQNFDFVLGPGDKMPNPEKNGSGLIISPDDFWISYKSRS